MVKEMAITGSGRHENLRLCSFVCAGGRTWGMGGRREREWGKGGREGRGKEERDTVKENEVVESHLRFDSSILPLLLPPDLNSSPPLSIHSP